MRLPNNLSRELVSEIVDSQAQSPTSDAEKSRTASNSAGISVERCLGIGEGNIESKLSEMCTEFKLNERESIIFQKWFENGVRYNTSVWFSAVAQVFEPFVQEPPIYRKLATLMFIDTFNRADGVFDLHRGDYVDYGGRVLNEWLDDTPILELGNGDVANVGDFKAILFKVIRNCGDYSNGEYSMIRWHADYFIETATKAQKDFEGKRVYSKDEALALRWLTVGPMVDTISSIYAMSFLEVLGGEDQFLVREVNGQFRDMIIAWQLVDDYRDLCLDVQRCNVNIVAGMMYDKSLNPHQLDENFQSYFGYRYPEVVEEMRHLYRRLTQDLDPKFRRFIESVTPDIFFESTHELDMDDGDASYYYDSHHYQENE